MKTIAPIRAGQAWFRTNAPVPAVDQITIEERAAAFTKRRLKASAKLSGLKLAVS